LKSFKLVDGDIVIENGELLMVSDDDELIQQIKEVVSINLNEWFLNLDHGIDFSIYFQKPMNQELIQTSIIEKIQELEQITTVEITSFEYDERTRKPNISFVATKTNGETVEGGI
jgi:hypothetical protein